MEQKKVLWIEPDDDDYELLTEIIDGLPVALNVIRYTKLPEAIEYLQTIPDSDFPSAIVTEYSRLWVDALGKLEEIVTRMVGRQVPLIVFTAYKSPELVERLPRFDVIHKPFDYHELDLVVHKVVEHAGAGIPYIPDYL